MRIRSHRALHRDDQGGVTILAAIMLPLLIGLAGLVVEFGGGLLTRVEAQRIADLSVYAAATAYSTTNDTAKMIVAAQRLAALNGVPAAKVTTELATSPRTAGNQAVKVTVATTNRLVLASVLGFDTELSVAASSFAEISAQSEGCIIALSGAGTGVTLSGGTTIQAPNCAVSSNVSVAVPCGTKIITKSVTYNGSAPSVGCSGITAPSGQTVKIVKKATADPLAAQAGVTTAAARIATVGNQTAPAAPSAPTLATVPTGKDISFGWNASATQSQAVAIGCTAAWVQPMWTLTCPNGGNYKFGKVTVDGGISLKFNSSGTAATTYSFSDVLRTAGNGQTTTFGPGTFNFAKGMFTEGVVTFGAGSYNIGPTPNSPCWAGANYSICHVGSTLTFGDGTFNMSGGIFTGGGASLTFGAGTFNIGAGSGQCTGGGGQSICQTGSGLTFGAGTFTMSGGVYTSGGTPVSFGAGAFTLGAISGTCSGATGASICNNTSNALTFAGPSTFVMSGGVYNNGGSTLTFGSGSTNSYRIGANSAGDAISAGGGSKTTFADASGGLFQLAGNLNVVSGGGSCMTLPAASQHDIKGFFSSSGGTILGAGVYTVRGYIAFGANGGGSVTCNGATVGVSGTGVTLVMSGASTPTSGSCAGQAFCLAAGYNNVVLTAPTSGTTAKLVVVGPTTGLTSGATFAEGASTSLSGALYFPTGPILMSGGATVGNGAGQCLQIIGSQITLTGGTAAGSMCFASSTSGGGVALVQ